MLGRLRFLVRAAHLPNLNPGQKTVGNREESIDGLWRRHRGLVQIADRCDQIRDGGAFCLRQVRVPDVGQQDHPGRVAAVPGLVLVGIVEGEAAAFLPMHFAHVQQVQRAMVGNHQAQMQDRARIAHPAIRQDMRLGA